MLSDTLIELSLYYVNCFPFMVITLGLPCKKIFCFPCCVIAKKNFSMFEKSVGDYQVNESPYT
jgi:hypothetical protein